MVHTICVSFSQNASQAKKYKPILSYFLQTLVYTTDISNFHAVNCEQVFAITVGNGVDPDQKAPSEAI